MTFYSGSLLFSAVVSLLLGSFVYWQGKNKPANVTLTLLSSSIALWTFGQFMGEVVAEKDFVLLWTRINIAGAILIPAFYAHFVRALLRDEDAKNFLRLVYAAALVLLLLDLTPWFVADVAPQASFRYYPVAGPAYPFFAVYLFSCFGVSFFKLARFLKSNQAKYVFFASLIGALGGATAFFPVFNINLPVVSHLAMPLYLAITIYAIVKHQLLDINVVVRQGLIYSLLTLFFTGIYSLTILAASALFRQLSALNEITATLAVVFISVLIFSPVKDRIQDFIDRLFFRGSYYYQKMIRDLSAENLKLYHGLLQADKLSALGTIAAGMAHEIKNPLASIKGLTQILPENLEDSEFIKKYTEIVPRQLERINRIVEDLLDFGQPAKVRMEPLKLGNEIEAVIRLIENQCRKANVQIEKQIAPGLMVYGNAEKLSQAILNLALNAVQSMPNGGKIRVKSYPLPCPGSTGAMGEGEPEGWVRVEISDTGSGIPPEKLDKIFEPFFTTKEKGSGLGLAVTYRVIKEHQGKIEVESALGKGTTFKIWLPATKPKQSV